MTGRAARAAGALFAAALLTLPIIALSRLPYSPAGGDAAVLRLSWRMNITAREQCRPRTQQELDALPVHMRTPEVCTRDAADYFLITRIGTAALDTVQLIRGGVKGDRPLFVQRETPVESGTHAVVVELQRVNGDSVRHALLRLDTVIDFEAGAVRLVTTDRESATLTVR